MNVIHLCIYIYVIQRFNSVETSFSKVRIETLGVTSNQTKIQITKIKFLPEIYVFRI